MSRVHVVDQVDDLGTTIARVFAPFGGGRGVLRGREEVYLKINAVDLKEHCYTPPDFIAALVQYLSGQGARTIYVMDNCTQGNFTRLVYHATGISRALRRSGARALYLDEDPVDKIVLPSPRDKGLNRRKYDLEEIGLSRTVMEKLVRHRDEVVYINVPKFKTHCMTTVTLGIKNQWGFVGQKDRVADHNDLLHNKFTDILELVRPDFTLVDAREATQNGHYPAHRLLDRSLVPYGLVVGGDDVVSVDSVCCRLMGFPWQEVKHVRLAHEQGLGVAELDQIEVIGDVDRHRKSLSWELLPIFPRDVDVHRGETRCCLEGCASNVMATLQVLSLDFNGQGGFSIVMGQGWEPRRLEGLQQRVLVVGKCAVREVGQRLLETRSPDLVAFSDGCNNLTQTITHLLKWMKVSPLGMVPVSPVRSLWLLMQARAHGSLASIPPLLLR